MFLSWANKKLRQKMLIEKNGKEKAMVTKPNECAKKTRPAEIAIRVASEGLQGQILSGPAQASTQETSELLSVGTLGVINHVNKLLDDNHKTSSKLTQLDADELEEVLYTELEKLHRSRVNRHLHSAREEEGLCGREKKMLEKKSHGKESQKKEKETFPLHCFLEMPMDDDEENAGIAFSGRTPRNQRLDKKLAKKSNNKKFSQAVSRFLSSTSLHKRLPSLKSATQIQVPPSILEMLKDKKGSRQDSKIDKLLQRFRKLKVAKDEKSKDCRQEDGNDDDDDSSDSCKQLVLRSDRYIRSTPIAIHCRAQSPQAQQHMAPQMKVECWVETEDEYFVLEL